MQHSLQDYNYRTIIICQFGHTGHIANIPAVWPMNVAAHCPVSADQIFS